MGKVIDRAWSQYQLAVFADFEDDVGHTVVEAVAGSGKTTTMAEGLRFSPRHNRKGMIAFNKSVAAELQGKVPSDVDTRTVHSLGMLAVRRAFGRVEVDEGKAKRIANEVLREMGFTRPGRNQVQEPFGAGKVAKLVGFAKNCLVPETELRQLANLAIDLGVDDDPKLNADAIAAVAGETMARCAEERTVIDYDDMVWFPARHQLRPSAFDVLVVDETQDLNPAQLYLARALLRPNGRIVAVGDRYQSIYAFRGADSRAIPRMIDELPARVLPLSISYRCPKAVASVVREIVPHFEAAPNAEEGLVTYEWTVDQMLDQVRPGDFVLSRTKAPQMSQCLRLLARGIPACVAGKDIGKSLVDLLERSGTESVLEATRYLRDYCNDEVARLMELEREEKAADVRDRVEALLALCEGERSCSSVRRRIESLFRDDEPKTRVVFSTVHKAKGLERDNVWINAPTFRLWQGGEEANLYYVACTRARKHLAFVGDLRK